MNIFTFNRKSTDSEAIIYNCLKSLVNRISGDLERKSYYWDKSWGVKRYESFILAKFILDYSFDNKILEFLDKIPSHKESELLMGITEEKKIRLTGVGNRKDMIYWYFLERVIILSKLDLKLLHLLLILSLHNSVPGILVSASLDPQQMRG